MAQEKDIDLDDIFSEKNIMPAAHVAGSMGLQLRKSDLNPMQCGIAVALAMRIMAEARGWDVSDMNTGDGSEFTFGLLAGMDGAHLSIGFAKSEDEAKEMADEFGGHLVAVKSYKSRQ